MLETAPAADTMTDHSFDVIVIGAGPAGLCCSLGLAQQGYRVGLVERQSAQAIAEPNFDGREIALTMRSIGILQNLGVWQRIAPDQIAPLKSAVVMTSADTHRLLIDHRETRQPALGFLVPNHGIRSAAYGCVADAPRVRLLCSRQMTGLTIDDSTVKVRCGQGETLHGRLLVVADSRFSDTRRAVGIAADMLDFGKTMLVCRMRHEVAHRETAWEWFKDQYTVALLPLNDRESSVVVTVSAAEALRLQQLDASEFDRDIEARFEHRLGAMRLASTRHAYPLVASYARRFVAARCALIGDAAVGMHPVTAHGFNLGLKSQDALLHELQRASGSGIDIGSAQVLHRYEAAHRKNSRSLFFATNAIVRLYTDARPLHRLCRSVGLRLAGRVRPVKQLMLSALTEVAPGYGVPFL
ncbi:MAG: 5-demethoxyubiquinol-8 5-hydroxylase UbiM [Steroidobacteraceae bacterium]|jgi:ubiquinone biosynthesis UbiH/UbiF/VisC/COQ6 family hydroxylase